jgi:phage/plasmid-like protein (TIGR03299 family)
VPAYAKIDGTDIAIGRSALVRSRDNSILDIVSDDWNPVQNEEAFEFFNEFVMAGDMEMHTAGSLKNGQIVWGLAKIKDSFELFKGDRIDSYLLFSNFHKYGFSTDVRFTPIRVVCNNTLTLSLNSKVERMVKVSHRKVFDPGNVKEMLGIATDKLSKYKEMAEFLGSKQAKGEDIVEYFTRIFPVTGSNDKKKKEVSKNAQIAIDILHTQPGAEFAEGSWWQPFNAVTYMTDHLVGRSSDTRLTSAWYGANKGLKTKALELAVEMAEAA